MDNTKANNSITKKDLGNLADRLEKSFDEKFEKRFSESEKKLDERFTKAEKNLEKKFDERFKESEKKFDVKLGQFTDDVLLPAISEVIRKEIGAHRYEMKDYIDKKMAENKGDIVAYIKPMTEKDREWKRTVLDVLERHKLARQEELNRLCDLVALQ